MMWVIFYLNLTQLSLIWLTRNARFYFKPEEYFYVIVLLLMQKEKRELSCGKKYHVSPISINVRAI